MSTRDSSALPASVPPPPTFGQKSFVALQHFLPQHLLTSVVYKLTRSRTPFVKNSLIGSFMKGFRPEMSDAVQPDPFAYESFNDFFTRALKPDARPFKRDANTLISPVDGTIAQIGRIEGNQILQAKGRHYSLEALLARPSDWTAQFRGGSFATLYLAPYNYHRIHMPMDGTLRAAWYVPGDLFSVNATTATAVDRLFARNERVVCLFEYHGLTYALVLVGALFVGSMTTIWHGEITPRRPRKPLDLPINSHHAPLLARQGDEMGRFNMGSTVVLVLPPGTTHWLAECKALDTIRMGQPLARITRPPEP
jgi:phosphatidylserine decarboxylase